MKIIEKDVTVDIKDLKPLYGTIVGVDVIEDKAIESFALHRRALGVNTVGNFKNRLGEKYYLEQVVGQNRLAKFGTVLSEIHNNILTKVLAVSKGNQITDAVFKEWVTEDEIRVNIRTEI